jgi:hypothetical protein
MNASQNYMNFSFIWEGSAIIGGDFNLVRSQLDKNNGIIDHRWADKFNVWI